MSTSLDPARQYMMPVNFGPQAGPRANQHGERWPTPDSRSVRVFGVLCRADEQALAAIMPEGFVVDGEPVVAVAFVMGSNIDWLAGGGYNMLIINCPVVYTGKAGTFRGRYYPVLWENLTDAILTGRDQIGFNKIFADLPDPIENGGEVTCSAAWRGHRFMEFTLSGKTPATEDTMRKLAPLMDPGDGVMHVKYIPRTGEWGVADVHQVVMTPAAEMGLTKTEAVYMYDQAALEIFETEWKDMPTQYHIVEGLRALKLSKPLMAFGLEGTGNGDLFDQKIIDDLVAKV